MKRLVLLLTFMSATSATRTLAAPNTEVAAVVHLQQQAIVEGVIKHCKMGIQKEGAAPKTLQAFEQLTTFLKGHPNALECVVDTFQACVNEKCMDVPARVEHCLRDYEEYGKTISLPNPQLLQEKITTLVVSYFNFQLTFWGKVDHYTQSILQKSRIGTYLELARPWISLLVIYAIINASLTSLEEILSKDIATKSGATAEIKKSFDENSRALGSTVRKFILGCLKEFDGAAVKVIGSVILTPGLQKSFEKIENYFSENSSKLYAAFINKSRKSGYPVKASKESFDTIEGYEDTKLLLTPLMDFCMNLEEYRAADLRMARGYLFEGSLADGRKMAQALAGEMSKKLAAAGSATQWLVAEIHGSLLLNRELESKVKKCLEFGPTVLIINNLDWPYTQKDVDPCVYADIINVLAKYLSQESDFPLLICATTQDHTVIDPVMLESHKFELVPLL